LNARFAQADWTLAFGPFAFETSVPSDACHPWHWSLSARITVGAGWCGKPLDQPGDQRAIQTTVPPTAKLCELAGAGEEAEKTRALARDHGWPAPPDDHGAVAIDFRFWS